MQYSTSSQNKIKALHVTGLWSGNYYYRCYLPALAKGWLVSNETIDGEEHDGEELVRRMDKSNVVLFQRPNSKTLVQLMELAKMKGKIVVFDDDDTFKVGVGIIPKTEEEKKKADEINENRKKALSIAHGAIASTEVLANELREFNDNVTVIENCIDPMDADDMEENDTERPRILILGSVVSNDDWIIARKAIEMVADRVTFVLIGVPENGKEGAYTDDMKFWNSLPHIEKIGFTPFGDYYNRIIESKADVCIAPRADNLFNRCKSNLKFLECSLFGLPFVGQAFDDNLSPYQVNKEDAKHLVLAKTEEDWVGILEKIAQDKDCFKKLGKSAQQYVIENYDINKHAHKYEDFYKTLL